MSSDDSPEVDFSVITRSIKCGGPVIEQIVNGIHYGTSEVRCLLLDECDLIIECKVCRNLFRSLANFIAHKRVYCLDAFQDPREVTVPVTQTNHTDVVVVQPEAPEENGDVETSCSNTGGTVNSVDDAEQGSSNSVEKPTNSMDMTIRQMQEGSFKGTSEAFRFYTEVADRVEQNEMSSELQCLRQEKIPGNPNAVRISVLETSDVNLEENSSLQVPSTAPTICHVEPQNPVTSMLHSEERPLRSARLKQKTLIAKKAEEIQTESPMQIEQTNVNTRAQTKDSIAKDNQHKASAHVLPRQSARREIRLRERAKNMFLYPVRKGTLDSKDCNLKTRTCLICKIKYGTLKSLRYHMRALHSATRQIFPCPKCSTKFMYMWGLTRHLKRTHNLSKSQVEKMRNKLKSMSYEQPINASPGSPKQSPNQKNEETECKNSPKKTTSSPVTEKADLTNSPHSKHSQSNSQENHSTGNLSKSSEIRVVNNLSRISQRREEQKRALTLNNEAAVTPKKNFSVKILSRTVNIKSPQFASGLSLVHCQICGKAFAKKASLKAHIPICRKSSVERPRSTDEHFASRRAAHRRRQMSPTKIERTTSVVERDPLQKQDSSKSETTPEVKKKQPDEDFEGEVACDGAIVIAVGDEDSAFEVLGCSKQAKPAGDSPKLRSSLRRQGQPEESTDSSESSTKAMPMKKGNELEPNRSRARIPSSDTMSESSTVSSEVMDDGTASAPGRRSLARRRTCPKKTAEGSTGKNSPIPVSPRRQSLRRGVSPANPEPAQLNSRSEEMKSPNKTKSGNLQRPQAKELIDLESSDIKANMSEDNRKTRLLPRRQSTFPKTAEPSAEKQPVSGKTASDNNRERSASRAVRESLGNELSNDALGHEETREKGRLKGEIKSEAETRQHISDAPEELGAIEIPEQGDQLPPPVKEIWVTKSPGKPTKEVKVIQLPECNQEISEEELLQMKVRTEAEIEHHISEISKELGAVEQGDDQVRLVEEIWIGKTAGKPTEKVKSNRIYVVNPKMNKKGRPSCQDTKRINALVDENNLECYHCGDVFASVSNIRRHAIRHLGWRRYGCKLCTYCSYHKSEMKSHLSRVHRSVVSQFTGNSLNFCITDLSREAARMRADQRRQTISRRVSNSEGSSRTRSPSPKPSNTKTADRRKPAVSETNIVESNARKFNISTRLSPREYDIRPFTNVNTMQTLLTRKGFYPKPSAIPSTSTTADSGNPVEAGGSGNSEGSGSGSGSRPGTPVSGRRSKTRSIDFKKTRTIENPWVDGFYKHLSGGTLEALRKDQGFHSFRNLGRSSLGSLSTNSAQGSAGVSTRHRSLKSNTTFSSVETEESKPEQTSSNTVKDVQTESK